MYTEESFRGHLEAILPSCIERAKNSKITDIIPNKYFSRASSEVREMYIYGYYIGSIALSQSLAEGLTKFICERNKMVKYPKKDQLKRVEKLLSNKIITNEISNAFIEIEKCRNDFIHMNKNIETNIKLLEENAKNNIENLFKIEEYIFGHDIKKGKISPKNPAYWDVDANGNVEVFLRISL